MEKISYIASAAATILGLCEPFNKKMKTVLIFSLIGNLLVGISYILAGGFSGAVICFTAAVQLLINYSYASKGKTLPKGWVWAHTATFLAVNLMTFHAWYDVLSLIAAMLFVLSVAQSDAKNYRAIYIPNSLVWIAYDLLAKAYGNLMTHTVLLTALLIAVAVRDGKRLKSDKE